MPRHHHFLSPIFFLVIISTTACKSPTPASLPPPVPSHAPSVDWPPEPTTPRLSLFKQLQYEAERRPSATLPAETIFLALSKQGIVVPKTTQVLARPIGARFCLSGMTDLGLAVVACEFSSNEDARKGMAYSQKMFSAWIPNRRLFVNQNTLLTLTPANRAADLLAQTATTTHIFQTL